MPFPLLLDIAFAEAIEDLRVDVNVMKRHLLAVE